MSKKDGPLVLETQGSFRIGGRVIEVAGKYDPTDRDGTFNDPAGQLYHVDHLYTEYQIPVDARPLPLVFVHGNNLDGTTWDTTPDGREGFRTIFARRRFPVYVVDFPRRGRAGAPSFTGKLGELDGKEVVPDQTWRVGDRWSFHIWRVGNYPTPYEGSQFHDDPSSVEQALMLIQPSFTDDPAVIVGSLVALIEEIGPVVLVTHSQGGLMGWLAAMQSDKVRGIVAYEPTQFVFPPGRMPETAPPVLGYPFAGIPAAESDWTRLIQIPIQVVFGDYIATEPHEDLAFEFWRNVVDAPAGARGFVGAVKAAGGDISFVHLPEHGIRGNSHFVMNERNNVEVADLMSAFLHEKGLD